MLNSHFILIRLHSFLHTWCNGRLSMRAYTTCESNTHRSQRTTPHTWPVGHKHIIQMTQHREYKFSVRQHLVLKMLMLYIFSSIFFGCWCWCTGSASVRMPFPHPSIHFVSFVPFHVHRALAELWKFESNGLCTIFIGSFCFFVFPFRGNAARRACAQTVFSYILIDRYRIL